MQEILKPGDKKASKLQFSWDKFSSCADDISSLKENLLGLEVKLKNNPTLSLENQQTLGEVFLKNPQLMYLSPWIAFLCRNHLDESSKKNLENSLLSYAQNSSDFYNFSDKKVYHPSSFSDTQGRVAFITLPDYYDEDYMDDVVRILEKKGYKYNKDEETFSGEDGKVIDTLTAQDIAVPELEDEYVKDLSFDNDFKRFFEIHSEDDGYLITIKKNYNDLKNDIYDACDTYYEWDEKGITEDMESDDAVNLYESILKSIIKNEETHLFSEWGKNTNESKEILKRELCKHTESMPLVKREAFFHTLTSNMIIDFDNPIECMTDSNFRYIYDDVKEFLTVFKDKHCLPKEVYSQVQVALSYDESYNYVPEFVLSQQELTHKSREKGLEALTDAFLNGSFENRLVEACARSFLAEEPQLNSICPRLITESSLPRLESFGNSEAVVRCMEKNPELYSRLIFENAETIGNGSSYFGKFKGELSDNLFSKVRERILNTYSPNDSTFSNYVGNENLNLINLCMGDGNYEPLVNLVSEKALKDAKFSFLNVGEDFYFLLEDAYLEGKLHKDTYCFLVTQASSVENCFQKMSSKEIIDLFGCKKYPNTVALKNIHTKADYDYALESGVVLDLENHLKFSNSFDDLPPSVRELRTYVTPMVKDSLIPLLKPGHINGLLNSSAVERVSRRLIISSIIESREDLIPYFDDKILFDYIFLNDAIQNESSELLDRLDVFSKKYFSLAYKDIDASSNTEVFFGPELLEIDDMEKNRFGVINSRICTLVDERQIKPNMEALKSILGDKRYSHVIRSFKGFYKDFSTADQKEGYPIALAYWYNSNTDESYDSLEFDDPSSFTEHLNSLFSEFGLQFNIENTFGEVFSSQNSFGGREKSDLFFSEDLLRIIESYPALNHHDFIFPFIHQVDLSLVDSELLAKYCKHDEFILALPNEYFLQIKDSTARFTLMERKIQLSDGSKGNDLNFFSFFDGSNLKEAELFTYDQYVRLLKASDVKFLHSYETILFHLLDNTQGIFEKVMRKNPELFEKGISKYFHPLLKDENLSIKDILRIDFNSESFNYNDEYSSLVQVEDLISERADISNLPEYKSINTRNKYAFDYFGLDIQKFNNYQKSIDFSPQKGDSMKSIIENLENSLYQQYVNLIGMNGGPGYLSSSHLSPTLVSGTHISKLAEIVCSHARSSIHDIHKAIGIQMSDSGLQVPGKVKLLEEGAESIYDVFGDGYEALKKTFLFKDEMITRLDKSEKVIFDTAKKHVGEIISSLYSSNELTKDEVDSINKHLFYVDIEPIQNSLDNFSKAYTQSLSNELVLHYGEIEDKSIREQLKGVSVKNITKEKLRAITSLLPNATQEDKRHLSLYVKTLKSATVLNNLNNNCCNERLNNFKDIFEKKFKTHPDFSEKYRDEIEEIEKNLQNSDSNITEFVSKSEDLISKHKTFSSRREFSEYITGVKHICSNFIILRNEVQSHLHDDFSNVDIEQINSNESSLRNYQIKLWNRNNVVENLNQGHYTHCCIAPGSSNSYNMGSYIISENFNIIEIRERGKIVGQAFCYIGADENKKTHLVIDNVEINNNYSGDSDLIKQNLIEFSRGYRDYIGGLEKTIKIGNTYNDITVDGKQIKASEVIGCGDFYLESEGYQKVFIKE